MKKLTQIVIALQFVLMLTHCATVSTEQLYADYAACRAETLHVKTSETGVVMVHSDGSPVMVYETGACPDEPEKWDNRQALKEKRRREAVAAQAGACPKGETRWCVTKGPGDSRCSCVDNYDAKRALERAGYY